jgi:alkylation response protein AidB-like acyl-CoA dehydrogenase
MDLNDTPEQAQYRAHVRSWLEQNRHHAPPADDFGALHGGDPEPLRGWQRRLADAGFVGITWPKEFGGEGLTTLEQVIFNSELARLGLPGILDHIGVGDCGPTVIAYGTDAQKDRFLAPLLRADEVWCQLFSEPAAGSDLANVQTRAVRDDDGWRLNGQKVWTTNAQIAAYGLCLARTDPDVRKHKGLTMFAVPMDAPGVTIRPLRQISGHAAFNEVFLDGVELGAEATIGPVDAGWAVAMTTLMFERFTLLAAFEQLGWSAQRFAGELAEHPASADSAVRQRLADLTTDLLALRFAAYRTLTALEQGAIPGAEAGMTKVTMINAGIRGAELVADVLGPEALAEDSFWGRFIAEMPGLRTGGGTEEIVRTMIGDRVLGLPPEPRYDKDVPFSELGTKREGVPA